MNQAEIAICYLSGNMLVYKGDILSFSCIVIGGANKTWMVNHVLQQDVAELEVEGGALAQRSLTAGQHNATVITCAVYNGSLYVPFGTYLKYLISPLTGGRISHLSHTSFVSCSTV